MSILNNSLLLGADAGAGGYQVARSLRFNSSDSGFCARTAGTPTASGTWTFSVWVKRSKLGADTAIFGGRSGGVATQVYFKSDNTIRWYENTADFSTTAVFRDVSSWYHFVFTKNGSSSCTIYVNGVQLQQNTASVPSISAFNTSSAELFIGAIGLIPSGVVFYGDHYLADAIFVDGQALDPSSFVETSATTGRLEPKQYAGSFGTNGFWLKFSDNSAATATTLGKDYSGNSNNWTPNNLSITAGAGNDSLVDTPTSYGTDDGLGGSVRGNYCTLNPLSVTAGTFTNGNLEYVGPSSFRRANGTTSVSSGKWYWEVTALAASRDSAYNNRYNGWGIGLSTTFNSSDLAPVDCFVYWDTGQYQNWSSTTVTATSVAANDVLGFALNLDANTITVTRNGSTVVNAVTLGVSAGTVLTPFHLSYDATYSRSAFNFGQRQWAYAAPAGFKALCTQNLPAPVVAKPNTVMDVKLYTGTGSSQTISGLGFSPDFVWIKSRGSVTSHALFDQIRGAQKWLGSNSTNAEQTYAGTLDAFTSDGFTVGNDAWTGGNTIAYASWCWDAGSSTVTNTQGSISSQVRANPSAGFSIVTYTGNDDTASTVGHGLNVAPPLVIAKTRTQAGSWWVYTNIIDGSNDYLVLNSTAAKVDASHSSPTSTVFNPNLGMASPIQFVAYCFAPVAGYSAFGSYTGNGSADGPFVYTGFRPAFVMLKRTDAVGNWVIHDNKRQGYNVNNDWLYPNLANSEASAVQIDMVSNGFKQRLSTTYNISSGTYIYAAFAESPFQYARAR